MQSDYGDDAAFEELTRRMASGTAKRARMQRLVDRALEAQQMLAEGHVHVSWLPVRAGIVGEEFGAWQRRELAHRQLPFLEAAVIHGYASPDQVERFLANSVLVEVFAIAPSTLDVQISVLMGPTLRALVDVDVEKSPPAMTGQAGTPPTLWHWRFDGPRSSERVRIEWQVDARKAFSKAGVQGGAFEGTFVIELPVTSDGGRALKQWRPRRGE